MNLLIVESPAKSKTLEKYLGTNFKVMSSVGHIRDLPKSDKKKFPVIEIDNQFKINYEIIKDKEKIIANLRKETEKAKIVYLATDPDREGEAIAWHLKEILNLGENYQRITFNEITEKAVLSAIKEPRKIDNNLKNSQEARRVLDRLFGYSLSSLIWKKVRYGLSAGRVQSPALKVLAEREKEIRKFKPETYYLCSVILNNGKDNYIFNFKDVITDKKILEQIQGLKEEKWLISSIKNSEIKQKAPAPFITSSLQQTASNLLGFSPSQTMRVAQKLYEKGLISYMRTDSTQLSGEILGAIEKLIIKDFGPEYLEIKQFKKKSKNSQEAHEAIRPTNINTINVSIQKDENTLYNLIRQRTLASQMSSAVYLREKATIEIKNFNFNYSVQNLQFPGFLKISTDLKDKELKQKFPFKKDELLKFIEILTEEKQTTPPNRFSEAGLIKELEKLGIGRPSTYASILKTLQDRTYAIKEGRNLIPTETGLVISDFLSNNFKTYISYDFTSKMEEQLDQIAEGKETYFNLISNFYHDFKKSIDSKQDIEKITNLGEVKDFNCPKCKSSMIYKLSKNGKFMSCSNFPDCIGARTDEGEPMKEPEKIGRICPKCEKADLVKKTGKYGEFISCSNYPKCKYIEEDPIEAKKRKTGVKCLECKKGELTEKKGRFGIFYACSEYPDCKFSIKSKPTGRNCHLCSKLMMEGTKTIPERCSDKNCQMHRPDKIEKGK